MAALDPVTRLRRTQTGVDRYKNPVYSEVETELPAARFAPRGRIPSPEPGREPVITEPTLYWRRQWPDVDSSDRLVVRGQIYEVVGEPADWRGKSAGGLVVLLREAKEAAD